MITYGDYIQGYTLDEAGTKLHRDYYAQFVDERVKKMVEKEFGLDFLKREFAKDAHFNTIKLVRFDHLALILMVIGFSEKLKEHGDFWSKAGGVCILKEAARQLVEGTK